MDGYALRAADTADAAGADRPVRLKVVGTVMAGTVLDRDRSGADGPDHDGRTTARAADAVCMFEECRVESDGEVVAVDRPIAPGTSVRRAGQDVAVGDIVLDAGTVVTPGHLGVLAMPGHRRGRGPAPTRIGVLSTGDELVTGPGPLPPGMIRDANRHSLLARCAREGFDPVDLGVVGDDRSAIGCILDRGGRPCDAIVTSGGVSVGDLDLVKVVLEKRSGGTMRWMQVAIRPAKPFAFGMLSGSGTPVFGLPGNPVSALVSFELFVRPAGRLLAGHRDLVRRVVPAVADAGFERSPDGKTHFVRAVVRLDGHGTWRVRPVAGQQSDQLLAMAGSNALAVLPDGDGVWAGGRLDVMPTDLARLGTGDPTGGSFR